ncbi:SF0329 family protein [Enterococcus larvae]|uniref:SF0329 family protein n=1 Tax=Enterococcus larvae TaxID=2794352 RepID=UPI003F409BF9
MATWSGIRNKLEKEYLAESLRGHIHYYATSYSKSPDHNGRAAIRYDGKEIIKGCYWNTWLNTKSFSRENDSVTAESAYMDDTVSLGAFDQQSFYAAFAEFDNQSIETSLESNDPLVRIFAVLDRRVGKRKLKNMQDNILDEPAAFQAFYAIRVKAENIGSFQFTALNDD